MKKLLETAVAALMIGALVAPVFLLVNWKSGAEKYDTVRCEQLHYTNCK